jgi:ankyrin repeat protein
MLLLFDTIKMDKFRMIVSNDLEGVNQWLKTGPDINKPNIYGKIPINCASYWNNTEIVKLLLAQPGIDFNKSDNSGWTPINTASNIGHTEIVKLLLAQPGINFNKRNNYGMTPINSASNNGHTEIVHILEEYQKNPIKMMNVYLREYFPQIIEEYFILMVLYSDDYFICDNEGDIGRFFKIVVILPQELQVLIANIIVGSSRNITRLPFVNEAIEKFLIKKLIFF